VRAAGGGHGDGGHVRVSGRILERRTLSDTTVSSYLHLDTEGEGEEQQEPGGEVFAASAFLAPGGVKPPQQRALSRAASFRRPSSSADSSASDSDELHAKRPAKPPQRSFSDVWSGASFVEGPFSQVSAAKSRGWHGHPQSTNQFEHSYACKPKPELKVDISKSETNMRLRPEELETQKADAPPALNQSTRTSSERAPEIEASESSGSDGEAEVLGKGGKALRVLSREDVKGISARDIRLRERELQRAERQRQLLELQLMKDNE